MRTGITQSAVKHLRLWIKLISLVSSGIVLYRLSYEFLIHTSWKVGIDSL